MLLPGIDDDVLLSPLESAVSIYLPVDPTVTDERAHLDRLDELFSNAAQILRDRGVDKRTCEAILQPGREAAAQLDFREHRPPAVVVFTSRDFARAFELPISVGPHVSVGHRFWIRPLLPLINGGPSFFVLALNASRGRLLECYSGGWIDRTPDVLRHPPDVAGETDFQPTAAGNPASSRRKTATGTVGSHSYEAPDELRKTETIEYLRRVSTVLEDILKDDHRSVILAADPAIGGHFRKLTGLRQLASDGISVNPNGLSNDELAAAARRVHHSPEEYARAEVLDRINARAYSGDPAVAIRLNDVVGAAHYGRVDSVVVAADESVWGRFDDATGVLTVHNRPQRYDDELLNEIVSETLRKGGHAYALAKHELPRQSLAVAMLRY